MTKAERNAVNSYKKELIAQGIEKEIEKLEQRLKSKLLTWQDREMLQEELDYLNSFLPQEVG